VAFPSKKRLAETVITGAVILGGWQLASAILGLQFWISSPVAVVTLAANWILDGFIWHHLQTTVEEVAIGFAGGAVVAIVGAFAAYNWPGAYRVVSPYITALYTIPKIALAPILIIVFGIGLWSKVALVGATTAFICFYQCYSGLNAVARDLTDQVRLMGASRLQLYRQVLLPASREWIVLGLRLAFPKAFSAAVVGEIIASSEGLGFLTRYYAALFSTTGTLAAILFIVAITLSVYYGLNVGSSRSLSRDVTTVL
jgi:NitT/TauT family transport system permease protein